MLMPPYDFCVVSPHGAGMQSFLYYLYKMGAPSTQWWEQRAHLQELRKQFPKCGITIDSPTCAITQGLVLQQTVPVFWLVRDPIALITSCVNQQIGDAIFFAMNDARNHNAEPCAHNKILHFINNASGQYCCYGEQLESAKNYSLLQVIDTTDLLPDRVCSTMKTVANTLSVPYKTSCETLFSISYNCFSNRAWNFFPQSSINSSVGRIKFHIIPSKISEFILYKTHGRLSTFHFKHNDQHYTASTAFEGTLDLTQASLDDLSHIIALRVDIITQLAHVYKQHAVSKEYVADYIQSNPQILGDFIKKQRFTLALLAKHAPEVLDRWTYFNSLLP